MNSTLRQLSIEYNFFKWKEATQHQFVAIYAIGPSYNKYDQQTIYFKDAETLAQHQFILANTTKQRWGSVDLSASFSQYLHDLSKTNASLGGQVNVNLTKGLSLNVGGSASIFSRGSARWRRRSHISVLSESPTRSDRSSTRS